MVDYGVEGLLDDKIQDGRRLKGKLLLSTLYRLVWCQVLCCQGQGIQ
jgi:hypothetical protein